MTPEQRANLRKLAEFVAAGVPGEFDMDAFALNKYREDIRPQDAAECGTCCCFAGYGPAAGIAPKPKEDWDRYVLRCFGVSYFGWGGGYEAMEVWNRLFDQCLAADDNTPAGAAQRAFDYLAETETEVIPHDGSDASDLPKPPTRGDHTC